MKTDALRQLYLDFFKSKAHKIFPSDSLVPSDDASLLFTGAGMNQFKPYFLGLKKDVKRAASCQKCLRTADIGCVGKTAYHHTFFEMLGNFSFGDYFKEEAIEWGWEFVTKELKLSKEKLWVSVFQDDDEAFNVWKTKIGLPESKIVRMDAVDNFWPSNAKLDGPNGPCGPCSEIYAGEAPGKGVEIWNLVFTQFDRQSDMTLLPLPQKNIDTGMGLERTASVLQDVDSSFDIDAFKAIRKELKALLKSGQDERRRENAVMDHIRAAVFCIADGVAPSNIGRGYVIRKLIRAASDHMAKAGVLESGTLNKLVPAVVDTMRFAYPELAKLEKNIKQIIQNEEASYLEVIHTYVPQLKRELASLKKDEAVEALAFKYRDTYGVPYDNIVECIEQSGFKLNLERFNEYLEGQKKKSREGTKITSEIFSKDHSYVLIEGLPSTEFLGYTKLESEAKLLRIVRDDKSVPVLKTGEEGLVFFDKTPFYAESGGQVGDTGEISARGLKASVFDTQWIEKCAMHQVKVDQGVLEAGNIYTLKIDFQRREDIMKNHTATHLLHGALRKVLGGHVKQSGSLVAPDRLRFDFTHFGAVGADKILEIENLVNVQIQKNTKLDKKLMSKDEAMKEGAIAFFGEKYGEDVRVVCVGDFSKELCGGTHLNSTGEIGFFKITSESSIQAGVRRIEAVTGRWAEKLLLQNKQELKAIIDEFRIEKETNILGKIKEVKRYVEILKNKAFSLASNKLVEESKNKIEKAKDIKGIKCWDFTLSGADLNLIKKDLAVLDSQNYSYAGVIYSTFFGQPSYYIVGSGDSVQRGLNCNEIIKNVNQKINGQGGGRPNFAVGGLKEPPSPEKINDIITAGTANIINAIQRI
ncbi:MAG: alanine--tRNA ligase [Omnitrophica bacterium RIFCSPHIGHO2_02_FULL_51_18]|nr:MAG: alanine--tRNA ligase [Omnitrophica bacterium RIFCSPHIGHO2_02_FULL_51_18]